MSYKIAVGSSDGAKVDLKFGEVEKFMIFEVDAKKRKISEIRGVDTHGTVTVSNRCGGLLGGCSSPGCGGNGNGCNGSSDVINKVELIRDCRCIVCKKIGFQAQKQLERKAISVFDIEGDIDEILDKIIGYYAKMDERRRGSWAGTEG